MGQYDHLIDPTDFGTVTRYLKASNSEIWLVFHVRVGTPDDLETRRRASAGIRPDGRVRASSRIAWNKESRTAGSRSRHGSATLPSRIRRKTGSSAPRTSNPGRRVGCCTLPPTSRTRPACSRGKSCAASASNRRKPKRRRIRESDELVDSIPRKSGRRYDHLKLPSPRAVGKAVDAESCAFPAQLADDVPTTRGNAMDPFPGFAPAPSAPGLPAPG